MHDPLLFRRQLTLRILGLLGAASLAVPQGACNSNTVTGTSAGTGAATTTTTTKSVGSTGSTGAGTSTTSGGDGGPGATVTGTGGAGTGGAGAGGAGGGAGGGNPNPPVEACFDVPPGPSDGGADAADDGGSDGGDAGAPGPTYDAGPLDSVGCPTDPVAAVAVFQSTGCPLGWEPYKVLSGPMTNVPGECCYMVYNVLCGPGGRPYLVDDQARVSASVRGPSEGGWTEGDRPELRELAAAERTALAEAWTADALLEHASVASFARFSLELLAAGAPADLVEAAHHAALDEIHHARLCFALASAYAGEEVAPGPFPLGDGVTVGASLAAIAASAVREGCVGETMAAVVASEQLARATDPAVRAALTRIAADEARHAELAWRTVAWAVKVGGSEVRAAVEEALTSALAVDANSVAPAVSPCLAVMEAHGRLDAATVARVVAGAMADVVSPAARTLLARDTAPAPVGGWAEQRLV